jgi:hypothetical protein
MDFSNHTFGSGLLAVNCFAKQGGILCFFVSLVNERTCFSKASPGTYLLNESNSTSWRFWPAAEREYEGSMQLVAHRSVPSLLRIAASNSGHQRL